MYSSDILTATFAAQNIKINECSGECCITLTIHISEYLPSDIDEPPPKINTKNKWKKKQQNILLFVIHFPIMQFFIACLKASNTLHGYWETRKSHQGGNNWLEKPDSPLS